MIVRFEAGRAEWVEEREWRIPYPVGDGFGFTPQQVEAVVVGDEHWPRTWSQLWTAEGWDFGWAIPDWFADFPRWLWSGDRLVLL